MEATASTASALEPAFARCVEAIGKAHRILIAMHEFPDGDALGSALALALAFRELGKEPLVYSPQGAPPNLRFLPLADQIVRTVSKEARFDLCFSCDAGDPNRLGPDLPDAGRRGELIVIDHHPRTRPLGAINLIDPQAAAVGVLVHRLFKLLGHPMSRDIATCLWVSIVSDTGSFRHSNTNLECMDLAQVLVARGVRPGEISSRMYESQPLERVRLLAEVLRTLTLAYGGRVAWVTAAREVFERVGTQDETADGFISYPRSIQGVEVALLFREEASGRSRVSFRSRGRVDVGTIASRFGGGGHHNASGASIEGHLDEVRAIVLREVEKALDRLGPA